MIEKTPNFHPAQKRYIDSYREFLDDQIEQSIPQRFEAQVELFADRLAVKSKFQTLAYRELNQQANRLARMILDSVDDNQEPVALLFDHDCSVVVALLAVLKTGKFFVVLDPSYPKDRLGYMLEDIGPRLLITDSANRAFAAELAAAETNLIDISDLDDTGSSSNIGIYPSPEAPALIIYTSGSSGLPKGVMHSHRSVMANVRNYTNLLLIGYKDRFLLHHSFSFAHATRIIPTSLLNGAATYLYDLKRQGFGELTSWITSQGITIFNSLPTTFRHFMTTLGGQEIFPSVRLLRLGGEPIIPRDLEYFNQHFNKHCIFMAAYGSSESLTISAGFIKHGANVEESKIPLGYALRSKDLVLLDDHGKRSKVGAVGEISIRSQYLSSGYWRRPADMQKKFIPDPEDSSKHVYLTDDLGRMSPDGYLVHLGRKDSQVKIRGHRVEIAEIEIALLQFNEIQEAVVRALENKLGEHQLAAYIVPVGKRLPTVTVLRQKLTQLLPDYMIPSAFVILGSLPLTPTGKVDIRALHDPGKQRPDLDASYLTPRTPIEEKVSTIWAEVLGIEQVGINDHFLDLGGDSLQATRVINRVIDEFQVEIPIAFLIETPTVEEMSVIISRHLSAEGNPNSMDLLSG